MTPLTEEYPKQSKITFKDMIGQRFGRLVIIECAGSDELRRMSWRCLCDCGVVKILPGTLIRYGTIQSCGCLQRERTSESATTHGHATLSRRGQGREYISWAAMHARCRNPNRPEWNSYGGRGISVCERWGNFENFLADMGPRPPKKSLDRINNDGNYEPGNCRWATQKEQMNNRRKTTHCKYGHELTPENIYQYASGRQCKKCNADRVRKRGSGL